MTCSASHRRQFLRTATVWDAAGSLVSYWFTAPSSRAGVEHRIVTAGHLTNISMRLGRKLAWDPEAEQMVGDDEANGWHAYEQRAPHTIAG